VADGFSGKNTCVSDGHSSRGKSTMCFTDPLNPFIIPIILFSSKKNILMAPLQPEIKGDKAILRGEIYRKDVSRFSIAESNSFEL